MNERKNRPRLDDGIGQLADLQRTAQGLFEREAGRLTRKYGLDDPRAQRMLRAAGGARTTLDALETTLDAAPQAAPVAPDETVVYGRVASDDLRGAARLDVMLEDTNGRVMRAAGSATTDASGRYVLTIPTSVAEKLAGSDYVLTARDAKGNVVHRATTTLKLERGQALESDLVVERRSPLRRFAPNISRRRVVQPTGEASEPTAGADEAVTPVAYRIDGEVRGARGLAIPNSLVRVYTAQPPSGALLGAAMTNRAGAFATDYQGGEAGAAPTNLYFTVHNTNGEEILAVDQPVTFDDNRVARVALIITKKGGQS